jgi:S-adenosylmethionine decarboxylase
LENATGIPELKWNALGKHTLLDFEGCRGNILSDKEGVENFMLKAAAVVGAETLHYHFHNFRPGVSGFIVGENAYMAIHTWPEYDSAAVDVLIFKKGRDNAVGFLCQELGVDFEKCGIKTRLRLPFNGSEQSGSGIKLAAEYALGNHILLDLEGCDEDILEDKELVGCLMLEAADVAGATSLHHHFCEFSSGGVGGVIIIAESHIAARAWPSGSAAVEVFTCGPLDCDAAAKHLRCQLQAESCKIRKLPRLVSKEFRPHKI